MADQLKFSALDRVASVGANDILYVVVDPEGIPTSKMVTRANLFSSFALGDIPRANSTTAGMAGVGSGLVANSTGFLSVNNTYTDQKAGNAYSNAVAAATALAGNAYSNATAYTDMVFATPPMIIHENYTAAYTSIGPDRFILVDTAAVNTAVTVTLNAAADSNGILHTVKSITNNFTVTVTSTVANTVEDPVTGNLLTSINLTTRGSLVTYLFDNGIYRLLSSH